ncbi:class I SAM-dependent methyltransferase [Archangium violaceum]|uniref:class I SAM-dependent methyltransferase n=1 Tax=Archangium violaceum TaxID=83451 RepID=UPI00069748A1|nr:class I SAM-dependent methyltransferase [Archangium violaceum]
MQEHAHQVNGSSHESNVTEEWASRWRAPLTEALDLAHAQILGGEISQGMRTLLSSLGHARATLVPEDWRRFCIETCRPHPVHSLVRQEPFTRRGFEKPRRYAGDAVMLDFVYEDLAPERLGTTATGVELNRFLCAQTSTASLRGRRDYLARYIDKVSEERADARILSVACGHLRESRRSRAVQQRQVSEFLALDQDLQSLGVIDSELGYLGIKPVAGSVKDILRDQLRFEDMDLVYASGLYDYLPQPVAIRLTAQLFSMLRPGGRLLLANYADPHKDSAFKAYMEACMDWWLIYRDESEVAGWMSDIPRSQLRRQALFRDETENLIYLELTRR